MKSSFSSYLPFKKPRRRELTGKQKRQYQDLNTPIKEAKINPLEKQQFIDAFRLKKEKEKKQRLIFILILVLWDLPQLSFKNYPTKTERNTDTPTYRLTKRKDRLIRLFPLGYCLKVISIYEESYIFLDDRLSGKVVIEEIFSLFYSRRGAVQITRTS